MQQLALSCRTVALSGWVVPFIFMTFSITSLVGVLKPCPFVRPAPILQKTQKQVLDARFPVQTGINDLGTCTLHVLLYNTWVLASVLGEELCFAVVTSPTQGQGLRELFSNSVVEMFRWVTHTYVQMLHAHVPMSNLMESIFTFQ